MKLTDVDVLRDLAYEQSYLFENWIMSSPSQFVIAVALFGFCVGLLLSRILMGRTLKKYRGQMIDLRFRLEQAERLLSNRLDENDEREIVDAELESVSSQEISH